MIAYDHMIDRINIHINIKEWFFLSLNTVDIIIYYLQLQKINKFPLYGFFLINHLFFLGASVFKFYSITIYEGKNHRSLFKTPLYLFRFKRARLLLKRFYFSYNYCFAVLVLYAWFKIKGGSFSNNKISNSKKTTEDEI